ncbi:MAG: hypothetical protein JKY65_22175 [Planctomycetes bacterium]|nr:hypothetical protein [Planctomycetota bacterium]
MVEAGLEEEPLVVIAQLRSGEGPIGVPDGEPMVAAAADVSLQPGVLVGIPAQPGEGFEPLGVVVAVSIRDRPIDVPRESGVCAGLGLSDRGVPVAQVPVEEELKPGREEASNPEPEVAVKGLVEVAAGSLKEVVALEPKADPG